MRAKLTPVQSPHRDASSRPIVGLIPGGPGLTSATLRSMDVLSHSFDLVYVDTPDEELAHLTFQGVVGSIEQELASLQRPIILLGHSFGGLLAIELADRDALQLAGLVAISTPMSRDAYRVASEQYYKFMTPELRAAEVEWENSPSRSTLACLFANYGTLYFSPDTVERGNSLLLNDPVSWKTFKALLPVISQEKSKFDFVEKLRKLSIDKYLLGGELDRMLPPQVLKADAAGTGCKFVEIPRAGHFVTFDQPEAVARLIEENFSTAK
jgi:pimeloyl-ACP methyl ester carboxylesterase